MNIRQCDAYAGIGSRTTPPEIIEQMTELAGCLAASGWTLRSGGASGADQAFEDGCGTGNKEIFLPYKNFQKNKSTLYEPPIAAIEMAALYHPTRDNFFKLKKYIQTLHARNMQQVFGEELDCPVQFVVCWTPDGCEHDDLRFKETGGTGQAISAASLNNIPVYNLANAGRLEELKEYCDNKTLQYSDYL